MSSGKKEATRNKKRYKAKKRGVSSKLTPSGVRSGGFARSPMCGELRCSDTFIGLVTDQGSNVYTYDKINVSAAGLQFCLNELAVGSAVNNRVGRKITTKAVDLSLCFEQQAATAKAASIRVVMVYDRQPNGLSLPNNATKNYGTTIYDLVYDSTASLPNASIVAPRRLDNIARFSVMMDKRFELFGSSTAATGHQRPFATLVKHVGTMRETTYNADSTAVSSAIQSGAIWLLVFATNAAGATDLITVTGNARLRFTT
jgi:hypothetical protein